MDEWGVVGVLVVVAGLFLSVGAPVIRLNSTITKLSTLVEAVQSRQDRQERDNTDSHRRLWKHNDEQDATLNDHETRITILERKD
ncbi:hypothetical protein [Allofournierella massiliensis]|uniref:Uncharacterized protein n=1 Tax=Allofournierella massiliensis TaxID=1650663 RepID=A0A4R1QES8_9FIRM|nr:hypothetical protein [Fournierella massiliensis]TCL47736.1 hypothetical protein EDD77_1614 [Fournierella massiliensis]